MKKEKNKYDLQAEEFCKKTNTKIEIKFSHYGEHFHDDKYMRDIYDIKMIRTFANGSKREYSVKFGNSINDSGLKIKYGKNKKLIILPEDKKYLSDPKNRAELVRYIRFKFFSDFIGLKADEIIYPKAPREYDVLTCLHKWDPGSFADFCSEFGYSDSISANEVYKGCVEEYNNLCALYNPDEMEMLQEIQ